MVLRQQEWSMTSTWNSHRFSGPLIIDPLRENRTNHHRFPRSPLTDHHWSWQVFMKSHDLSPEWIDRGTCNKTRYGPPPGHPLTIDDLAAPLHRRGLRLGFPEWRSCQGPPFTKLWSPLNLNLRVFAINLWVHFYQNYQIFIGDAYGLTIYHGFRVRWLKRRPALSTYCNWLHGMKKVPHIVALYWEGIMTNRINVCCKYNSEWTNNKQIQRSFWPLLTTTALSYALNHS